MTNKKMSVSAPGYGTFELIRTGPAPEEQPLSDSDIASLKDGIADIENGRYIEASALVEKLRAKYGLYR